MAVYQYGQPVLTVNADAYFSVGSAGRMYILVGYLYAARQAGMPIGSAEYGLLEAMTVWGDNNAATILWDALGGVWGMQTTLGAMGLPPLGGETNDWGWLATTPGNLALLLDRLYNGQLLWTDDTSLALDLLYRVIPEHRWGVSAGLAPDTALFGSSIAWNVDRWLAYGAGIIQPAFRDGYTLVVLTDYQPTFDYTYETIDDISAAINNQTRGGSPAATQTSSGAVVVASYNPNGIQLGGFARTNTAAIGTTFTAGYDPFSPLFLNFDDMSFPGTPGSPNPNPNPDPSPTPPGGDPGTPTPTPPPGPTPPPVPTPTPPPIPTTPPGPPNPPLPPIIIINPR